MSDPESPQTTTKEPDAMRPIPDGGLKQSMPEWLRRPPAWRNLPKQETSAAGPAAALGEVADAKAEPQSEAQLPEPDTSEIDPRSLVDISDLPQWLQDMAARKEALSVPPVTTDSPETTEEDMAEPEKRLEREPREERDVAFEPTDRKKWDAPEQETKVYGGGKPQGMNQTLMIALALIALVVIVLIAIAIF